MPEPIARVPEKWPASKLGERLQQTGKVRSAAAFASAAEQLGLKEVSPGGYLLPKLAGPRELAEIFGKPPGLLKITFPEGWTARQMAKRLDANHFTAAAEFSRLAYPPGIPVSPWEGKLFPDTYYLSPDEKAEILLQRLHDRFSEVTATLPRALPNGASGKPLSFTQLVTLASLVERETDEEDERPLIAGVLLNRLRKRMPLQCDASVQYAMERAAANAVPGYSGHKNRVLWRDLKIQSPYNTYLHYGLPPGPICNPGEASLRAAAAPKASEYLFYVMSPLHGRHYFAKDFAGHQRNIRVVKQERKG